MKNKKIITILSVILALCISFILVKRTAKTHQSARFRIGILQTASHPALDAARDGFIEELKNSLKHDVEFDVHNGEGSIANIHTIAQQFHNDRNLNGIFAIATPAAQAIAMLEKVEPTSLKASKVRPIFIAAVTDPHALGLTEQNTNVCGTKDMIDVKAEIDMLIQFLPHAKTVGLLFNNGEINSIALVKEMKIELESHGLTTLDFAINNESDLPTAADMAFLKSDVVLCPTDNMVASSIALIASLALKNRKPLIVSDNMLVKHDGVLAARGVDYKESGKQAAQIALLVLLNDKKPHELPIEQAKSDKIYVNKRMLDTLGVVIPESLKKDVIFMD